MASVVAQCHHIFGLRKEVNNNLCFSDEQTVVYPCGNFCVCYNTVQRCQRFFPGRLVHHFKTELNCLNLPKTSFFFMLTVVNLLCGFHRVREKPGHDCSGHQCQPPLSGSVRVWWEGHHHRVWPAPWTGPEEEGPDCRRHTCPRVCLHGFFPWLQVFNKPIRSTRLAAHLMVLGETQSPDNSND